MKKLSNKKWKLGWLMVIACAGCAGNPSGNGEQPSVLTKTDDAVLTYLLPAPQMEGKVSVETAMAQRRSQRNYQDREILAEELAQVLWAAYGVTKPDTDRLFLRGGFRTAPSAGALYPFEIYAVVGKVKGITPGVYRYISQEHKLVQTIEGDMRGALRRAALGQAMVEEAPVTVVYAAIFSRMTGKYGDRGRERYVCIDLGHSAQNIYLQAESLHLGTCSIGAFVDDRVSEVLQLPEEEEPLYLMPLGHYERQQ
ncbi:MAG: SagB/ThcOx family dehydrogenase [Bacteroidetes bacterium]|nr:SagB/ThcOx family dehydrogenase [Bacteroidota bacterium]